MQVSNELLFGLMFQKGILHRLIGLLLKKLMTSGQLYCPWSPVPLIKEVHWSQSLNYRSDVFGTAVHKHCWNSVCHLHRFSDFAFQRFWARVGDGKYDGFGVPTVLGWCKIRLDLSSRFLRRWWLQLNLEMV